ncbi:hypothetical protein LC653_24070 [Nostoc sp. CHAB 5784]|uniref:hypothetical protein n=1 Tax=Nostoc mirabile TaxID=2907820 RepID=UPI001E40B442|nr:hypothetical protein [Nostoc mirabile]MCC5666885.1 hypothetical protein [Nostoc mirabile CHAB5784]
MVKAKRHRLLEPNSSNSSLRPQTEMEKLSYWIRNFVFSFESGKLRSVLEAARFLRRNSGAWQVNPFKIISGLAVVINCDSWKDYKLLATKNKQLAYRIRKLDPEVDLLMLLSPDETIVSVTVIATLSKVVIKDFLRHSPRNKQHTTQNIQKEPITKG